MSSEQLEHVPSHTHEQPPGQYALGGGPSQRQMHVMPIIFEAATVFEFGIINIKVIINVDNTTGNKYLFTIAPPLVMLIYY